MPQRSSFPPKPHLHKQSGQARLKWKGKHYYLGKWGSPEVQKEYDRIINELALQDRITSTPGVIPRVTISEAVSQWLQKEAIPRWGAKSQHITNFTGAIAPLIRLHGDKLTTELDANLLEEVQLAMASGSWLTREERRDREERKIAIQWSRRVVNDRIARIRTIWRWVCRKKLAPANAHHDLTTLPPLLEGDKRCREKERRGPIPFDHLFRVVRCLRAPVRDMVLFQWWTGCRSGEVRLLRVEELDRSDDVWLFSPKHHKNSHRGLHRVIAIGLKGQAVLRKYLAGATSGYLFTSGPGRCYTQHSYARAFQRAAIRAGLGQYGYSPYCMRHSARMRFEAAMNADAARCALGHKTIDTTTHYGTLDIEVAKRLARKAG